MMMVLPIFELLQNVGRGLVHPFLHSIVAYRPRGWRCCGGGSRGVHKVGKFNHSALLRLCRAALSP